MFRRGLYWLVVPGTVLVALSAVFQFAYRPWQRTWGATEEEVLRVMPGDETVSEPTFWATRAVEIDARPEEVWPWLVQIGYRKAGFYSHDWLDYDRIPSAEEIIPEFDLPGHSRSWFAGYPELASAPGPYEPGPRFTFDPDASREQLAEAVRSAPTPTLDPTREEVYDFLDGFFGEMS